MARLVFPRETGLILRCAGKAGNRFQTTQGNRLSCRDQEGRRGSEEAVPGPSVFPSGDPGVSFTPTLQEVFHQTRLVFYSQHLTERMCGFVLGKEFFPRKIPVNMQMCGLAETPEI